MFEQDADEQLDGVADTQDVEEFQEIVVEQGKLLRNLGHAQGNCVAQAPKPDWFSGAWKWDVVQQVVDEAFEHLKKATTQVWEMKYFEIFNFLTFS